MIFGRQFKIRNGRNIYALRFYVGKVCIKVLSTFLICGVIFVTNLPLFSAYEAHVVNVTAEIINDIPRIDPPGGEFCNDGELKVELKVSSVVLEGSDIFYTIDGSNPDCYAPNGSLYTNPFGLPDGLNVVKARSCHDGKQSTVMTKEFDVSVEYCETAIKINKIFYDTDSEHGSEDLNEWIELYNPSATSVNIKDWKICDNNNCDILSQDDLLVGSEKFILITNNSTTWSYWNIPSDVIKIELNNPIGNGLSNTSDMLILKNSNGGIVDQMNWDIPNPAWINYNANLWNPGAIDVSEGCMLGRIPNGFDTDESNNFHEVCPPDVTLIYPVGHESWHKGQDLTIKWSAINHGGSN
ncbi:MAG: lamin tail domain-containing protein, partial [Minisyncoccia bacterium]